MISALKPIGVPVALTLIIIGLIQIKKINQFFLILIFCLIPNIVEFFFFTVISAKETLFLSIQSLGNFSFYLGKILLKLTIILKIFVNCYLFQKQNLNPFINI